MENYFFSEEDGELPSSNLFPSLSFNPHSQNQGFVIFKLFKPDI
jgi:hypothetical protein